MAPNPDLPDLETLLERPAAVADDDGFGRVALLLQAAADVEGDDAVDEALLMRLRDHGARGERRLATVLSVKTFVVAGTFALTTTAAAAGGLLPDSIQAPVEGLMRRAVPMWAAEHEPPAIDQAPASVRPATPPTANRPAVSPRATHASAGNGIGTDHDVANRGQHRAQPAHDAPSSTPGEERSSAAPSGVAEDRSSETPAGPKEVRPGQRQSAPAAAEPTPPAPAQGERRQPPAPAADAAPQPAAHAQPAPPADEHSTRPTENPGHEPRHPEEKE